MKNFILLLIIPFLSFTQKIEYYSIHQSELDYKGEFLKGYTWYDALGKNTLIISGSYYPREDDEPIQYLIGDAHVPDFLLHEIYAYHYVGAKNNTRLLWDIRDKGDKDEWLYFDDFSISDLDDDGIVEICIGYAITYGGSVKVIMHESKNKYAIRGNIAGWDLEYNMFGKDSFSGTPKVFQEHAFDMWRDLAEEFATDSE